MKKLSGVLAIILVVVIGYGCEWMRWHMFLSMTNSHISFFTWLLLFGGK